MPGETGRSLSDRRSTNLSSPVQGKAISQSPAAPEPEPSYYDISFLKPPVWKWEVAGYFFFGGLSGGSYLLSRMADRFGGKQYQDVARRGALIAALAALPCAPLLIKDLGDPRRFHHMLRIWKPTSPMNLGSWILTAYSPVALLNYVRYLARDKGLTNSLAARTLDSAAGVACDVAGIPTAIGLAGYTGVLLSCSANPLWTQNIYLGPMFSASALSTGAAAILLSMAWRGADMHSAPAKALEKLDTACHAAEAASYIGFLFRAGRQAKPLRSGAASKTAWLGTLAFLGSEAVKHLPISKANKRTTTAISAALGLIAGVSLRFSLIYGAHESGNDPRAARLSSRPRPGHRPHKFPTAQMAAHQRYKTSTQAQSPLAPKPTFDD